MAEKKKHRRHGELDYFVKDEQGRYRYAGACYAAAHKGGHRAPAILLLLGAGAAASAAGAGFLPAPGMEGCLYVLLPYVAGLAGAVSVLWGAVRLLAGGDPLREYVYDATAGRLPRRTLVAAGTAGAAVLGEILYLLLRGGWSGSAAAFLALELCSLTLSLLTRRHLGTMSWKKSGRN